MGAKKFFYVCAGLFLLAGAYAIGVRTAVAAQAANRVVGFTVTQHAGDPDDREFYVLTEKGDVYMATFKTLHMPSPNDLIGNFWKGGQPLGR